MGDMNVPRRQLNPIVRWRMISSESSDQADTDILKYNMGMYYQYGRSRRAISNKRILEDPPSSAVLGNRCKEDDGTGYLNEEL